MAVDSQNIQEFFNMWCYIYMVRQETYLVTYFQMKSWMLIVYNRVPLCDMSRKTNWDIQFLLSKCKIPYSVIILIFVERHFCKFECSIVVRVYNGEERYRIWQSVQINFRQKFRDTMWYIGEAENCPRRKIFIQHSEEANSPPPKQPYYVQFVYKSLVRNKLLLKQNTRFRFLCHLINIKWPLP